MEENLEDKLPEYLKHDIEMVEIKQAQYMIVI